MFLCFLLLPLFAAHGIAAETENDFAAFYSEAFSSIDEDTRALLETVGIAPEDYTSLMGLTPESLFSLVRELFGSGLKEKAGLFGTLMALMILLRLFSSFLPSAAVRDLTENIGALFLVFVLISASAAVSDGCVRAILLTRDCMLALVPILAAMLTFTGNPAAALSANGLVFAFGEGISVLYADAVLPLTAVSAALGSAAAISPLPGVEKFAVALHKGISWVMAFAAGIFSAVLGIRGVLAKTADSVSLKGLRFLISGSVPVVGSALSDALSSLTASLGLIKNGTAMLGVAAVAFINLPSVCSLLVWKGMLFVLSFTAELFETKKIPAFLSVFSSVFNVLLAVMLFHACVFVIALAMLISVKTA